MKNRPIILVLTSNDVEIEIAQSLKKNIETLGNHYVVVLDEKKYRTKSFSRILEKFEFLGNLSKKSSKKAHDKRFYGEIKKVNNAVKRFNPDLIVCLSKFTNKIAVATKAKAGFKNPISVMIPYFTADKKYLDFSTDTFFVENENAKDMLVASGFNDKKIVVCGLPIGTAEFEQNFASEFKEELELQGSATVLFNCKDVKMAKIIFDLLTDQGAFLNIIVFENDLSKFQKFRQIVEHKGNTNVHFTDKIEDLDKFIEISNIVITDANVNLMYKAFLNKKPVICCPVKSEQAKNDVAYLQSKGVVVQATDTYSVVDSVYNVLQSDLLDTLKDKINEKMESNVAVDKIAKMLDEFKKAE